MCWVQGWIRIGLHTASTPAVCVQHALRLHFAQHAGALKAYRKALEIHRVLKKEAAAKLAAQQQLQATQVVDPVAVYTIPLRLLNNTAVLLYR
jgi:hypothetical protein